MMLDVAKALRTLASALILSERRNVNPIPRHA
jgi:hypothetical protein